MLSVKILTSLVVYIVRHPVGGEACFHLRRMERLVNRVVKAMTRCIVVGILWVGRSPSRAVRGVGFICVPRACPKPEVSQLQACLISVYSDKRFTNYKLWYILIDQYGKNDHDPHFYQIVLPYFTSLITISISQSHCEHPSVYMQRFLVRLRRQPLDHLGKQYCPGRKFLF